MSSVPLGQILLANQKAKTGPTLEERREQQRRDRIVKWFGSIQARIARDITAGVASLTYPIPESIRQDGVHLHQDSGPLITVGTAKDHELFAAFARWLSANQLRASCEKRTGVKGVYYNLKVNVHRIM